MDTFSEIRPYDDAEVVDVLQRLLVNKELLDTMAGLRLPQLSRLLPVLLRPLVRSALKRQLRGVTTVHQFQMVVKHYMDEMIETSTDSFTVSGLDQLDLSQPHLLISNHRDIALDPAFVNYALYHNGGDTVRIAIGDNLLSKPYAADLMRLNKSFIVRRSAKGPRQMLAAYRQLSSYIRHSLTEEKASIWLAQREGRAKDGVDRTEPAIIKMLAMAQDKKGGESLTDFVQALNIVPVSISYEWDPCDGVKAQELFTRVSEGQYQKTEHEDLGSIAQGIRGSKGNVHVSFGQVLRGEFHSPDEVAAAVDAQIIDHYVLHPSNFLAFQQLEDGDAWRQLDCGYPARDFEATDAQRAQFEQRMNAIPEKHREYALALYANPVRSRLRRLSAGAD